MSFAALGLDPRLTSAIEKLGFDEPTSIQRDAIPPLLEGHDVIGRARTGSGKTAAFGLPLLHHLREGGSTVRGLVLAPTRELALQVTTALRELAKQLPVKVITLYGGTAYEPQIRALKQGAAIVVATPGRLLDHLDRGHLDLGQARFLVLDEADEMLRMGFIDDVARILEAAPADRQVALFSASMPPAIQKVAERQLRDPIEIQVEDKALTVDHIEQRGILVPHRYKLACLERVLRADPLGVHLVFVRTKKGCGEVADALAARGLAVDALHGDLNQSARERVLARFRAGGLKVVIATDVAARGLDVEKITHVVNFDFPADPETYVHRIGRTGRAGAAGLATTFATPTERGRFRILERTLRVPIEPIEVPSDDDIARGQRRALIDELRTTLEEAELGPVREWIQGILVDSERTDEDVAAAALYLLTQHTTGGFLEEGTGRRPEWARPARQERPARAAEGPRKGRDASVPRGDRPRGDRPGRGPGDAASDELFLAAGRNKGVRIGDIVAALCHETGLESNEVGRINIGERTAFIGVTPEAADRVLRDWDHLPIRGMKVPLLRSGKPSSQAPRPSSKKGPPSSKKGPPSSKKKGPPSSKKGPPSSKKGPPSSKKGPPSSKKGPPSSKKKGPKEGGKRPPQRRSK